MLCIQVVSGKSTQRSTENPRSHTILVPTQEPGYTTIITSSRVHDITKPMQHQHVPYYNFGSNKTNTTDTEMPKCRSAEDQTELPPHAMVENWSITFDSGDIGEQVGDPDRRICKSNDKMKFG